MCLLRSGGKITQGTRMGMPPKKIWELTFNGGIANSVTHGGNKQHRTLQYTKRRVTKMSHQPEREAEIRNAGVVSDLAALKNEEEALESGTPVGSFLMTWPSNQTTSPTAPESPVKEK
jgi:hypothetical protein